MGFGTVPGNGELLGCARVSTGEQDTVVVWRLDRIGRSIRHLINLMADLEVHSPCVSEESDRCRKRCARFNGA